MGGGGRLPGASEVTDGSIHDGNILPYTLWLRDGKGEIKTPQKWQLYMRLDVRRENGGVLRDSTRAVEWLTALYRAAHFTVQCSGAPGKKKSPSP